MSEILHFNAIYFKQNVSIYILIFIKFSNRCVPSNILSIILSYEIVYYKSPLKPILWKNLFEIDKILHFKISVFVVE